MGQLPASITVLSGDEHSFAGGSYPDVNPDSSDARNDTTLKNKVFDLLPPAFVALTVLFWAYGPKSWIDNSWSLVVATSLTTLAVLALEWIHERHSRWRMNTREFVTDLFYVILGATVITWVSTKLAEDPLTSVKHSLGITTQWAMHLPFVVQVALVIFVIEFGQYWMHRLMHNWTPFWLTHAPHHHITQLNAMKGAVGNPIELFLISLSIVALFDIPQAAQFCAFNVLAVVSTFAHANVRSDPPRFYSLFFTTIRHHSLHHSVDYEATRCNYANSLILIDRIFGTYREGESAIVGQDERKRLSIREQFLFPFQPLIARIIAKRSEAASATR
ncbi:fatty acid hydroxylase family protein [Novosphingobium sp. PhB165]|uniref:sterol desaturase family protein n=1 Tax=Novosphingobium sp. PhB165 TaxID=2485105 RepID=UPI0010506B5E|nr:sterol desaturase family protein [Novosphingobium sp. PhB165]TCM20560.1 fatty acid hydroxylase family protein [Novosphingobium sp. PhB165]